MQYAQITESGEAIQVTTSGNVEWDATHFCPASALTPEEAEQFRVVPLLETDPPTFDASTHTAVRDGCEIVGGNWQYKWRIDLLTPEQLVAAAQAFQASVVTATQARLDTFANTRNYDGILSACTYASSAVPKFAGEGQYAVNARDNTWATLYTLMGEVQAGTRPMPATVEEVIALLPELTWPA